MTDVRDHIDYRPVESVHRRSGWYLRCQTCKRWSRSLWITGKRALCRRCREGRR